MDRGIYAASSGGLYAARRLDITANNLANVSTVGFKAERLVSRQQTFEDTLASSLVQGASRQGDFERTPGVVSIGTTTDFTPGPVANTGNALDVALVKPNQFFVVQSAQGELLTRAGNFTLDSQRNLVAHDGTPVMGDGGPLQVPEGSNVRITGSGMVTVDDQPIGRVRVAQVSDLSQLERVEGTRFRLRAGEPEAIDTAELVPESVEMPNVSVVDAMIEMINAQKAFEAYTKTAQTLNEMNDRAVRNTRLSG